MPSGMRNARELYTLFRFLFVSNVFTRTFNTYQPQLSSEDKLALFLIWHINSQFVLFWMSLAIYDEHVTYIFKSSFPLLLQALYGLPEVGRYVPSPSPSLFPELFLKRKQVYSRTSIGTTACVQSHLQKETDLHHNSWQHQRSLSGTC